MKNWILPLWALSAACSVGAPDSDLQRPIPRQQALGDFAGVIDGVTGELRIVTPDRVSELGSGARALFSELVVDQNGIRGRGPRNTVEVSTMPGTGGFGPPRCADREVCGRVQIGSRLTSPVTNLTAHIEKIFPPTGVLPRAGNEPGPFMGLDNSKGLFVYRETVAAWVFGDANFTAPKEWSYERLVGSNIFFLGTVYGDAGEVPAVCGDGLVTGGETCDPESELGCEPGTECLSCQCTAIVCGDGRLSAGEQCDPGSEESPCGVGTACSEGCECVTVCGDGIVARGEACDPEATPNGCNPGVECGADCACIPVCGNGFVEPGEQCDDENTIDGDGCSSLCIRETICGDGNVEPGEACDDGNRGAGDGCASCNVEDGWACAGSPSICFRLTVSCESWGDTHITTFDGLKFDFQQVGEFIHAIDLESADLEIQARLAPYGVSTTVAVNIAVAARVGTTDRVEVRTGAGGHVLLINGVGSTLGSFNLPEGGQVENTVSTVTVTWPAGDSLVISDRGTYLDFTATLSQTRVGLVQGLCGAYGSGTENEFTKRDGGALPQPLSATQLYSNFGASWRLRGAESLFTYDRGQSTETYTDLAFPSALVSVDTLPAADYDAARTACLAAGVTDPALLDACILDLAVTQDESFVDSSLGRTPPAQAAPTGPTLATCVSWGDTHITTFDGLSYDFQQIGEWIAAANADHSFMVQARQDRWGGPASVVAVNTALAARVGADRVTFLPDGTMKVNGVVATPPIDLAGGSIVGTSGQYVIRWIEGDRLDVACRGPYLDYYLGLTEARRGLIAGGLCGTFDADTANDFKTRDGRVLGAPPVATLYDDFGDSWRVMTADPPLFDYGPGEDTSTFTDLAFPNSYVTSASLTPEQRAAAEAACRAGGVTAPDLLEACILDLGVTGDSGFVDSSGSVPPPSQGSLTGYYSDFSGPVGTEWSSTTRSTTPGSATRPPEDFLGRFSNGSVTLAFPELRAHNEVTVTFDLFVIESWDGSAGSVGPDRFRFAYVSNGVTTTLLDTTFANVGGTVQAYPQNFGASNPPQTGALEVNTLGYPFFGDSVYRISYTFPHSGTDLNLVFTAAGLQELTDESWGIDNVSVQLRSAAPVPFGTPADAVSYDLRQNCGSFCYYDEPHDNAVGLDVTPFGPSQLLDGVYGVDNWAADLGSGGAYEWVGWSNSNPTMIFRFPGIRSFQNIIMGTSRAESAGIFIPASIAFSFSDDGVTFTAPVVHPVPDFPNDSRADLTYDVGGASGQYVKIFVTRGGTWSFFDEVVFQ
ncbi:MAG: VWD domain-containing protein [Deltaproteobacteria bacterium]|nr:VWD domain-containing protein [Deltaproteobacteria bacterium]